MSGYDYGKPSKKMMDEGDEPTRKVAPGGGAGISFAPIEASQFTSPAFGASTFSTLQQKSMGVGAVGVTATAPQPRAFQWQLEKIPTLPTFHPLERTAVFVENASPSQVSTRISNILRERSIEASYDDDKAKVRCMTPSGVDFRIRLYRGRDEYSHGIIVEVQRRFGHSIDFHKDTNAILEAAQGLPPVPAPPALSGPSSLPMVSDSEDDYTPSPSSGASSLAMIEKMFGHNGQDSYYLGLQTLSSLTDAKKMGSTTAKNVSLELLKPDNEVGSKLVDIIVSKKQEDDLFNLQVMALSILANALSAVKGQIPEVLRELLRPSLLKELEQADSSNLVAAQQAARCFEYIWKGDHDVGQLQVALEKSKAVGEMRHKGLEQQCTRTLQQFS